MVKFTPDFYGSVLENHYHKPDALVPQDAFCREALRGFTDRMPAWSTMDEVQYEAEGARIFYMTPDFFERFHAGDFIISFTPSDIKNYPHLKEYKNWTLGQLFRNPRFTQRLLEDSFRLDKISNLVQGQESQPTITEMEKLLFSGEGSFDERLARMVAYVDSFPDSENPRSAARKPSTFLGGPYHYLLSIARKLLNLGFYENKKPGSVINEEGTFPIVLLEEEKSYSIGVYPQSVSLEFQAMDLAGRPDFSPLALENWREHPDKDLLRFRARIPGFIPKTFFDYILSSVEGYNPARVMVPKQAVVRGLDQFFDQMRIVVKKPVPALVEEVQSIVRNDPNYGKYQKGSLIWRAAELVPEQLNPVAQVQKVLGVFDIAATMANFLFEEAKETLFHQSQGAGELGLPDLSKFEQVKLFG